MWPSGGTMSHLPQSQAHYGCRGNVVCSDLLCLIAGVWTEMGNESETPPKKLQNKKKTAITCFWWRSKTVKWGKRQKNNEENMKEVKEKASVRSTYRVYISYYSFPAYIAASLLCTQGRARLSHRDLRRYKNIFSTQTHKAAFKYLLNWGEL